MPYRNELDAAHARINSLEQDKRSLLDKLRRKPKTPKPKKVPKVKCKQCGGWFHRMGLALFGIVSALILAGGFSWFLYTVITEHGPGDCYIQSEGLVFNLNRTVEWGSDKTIGQYRSMDEALQDAEKVKCEIK